MLLIKPSFIFRYLCASLLIDVLFVQQTIQTINISKVVTVVPQPRISQPEIEQSGTNYNPLCISLSPEYISSRDNQYVTFECLASICTDSSTDNENAVDKSANLDDEDDNDDFMLKDEKFFKMNRPLFDWNTELYHLLTTSGKCDSSFKNCWSRVEININDLLAEMNQEGLTKLEIECAVADLISNKTENSGAVYLFGRSISTLKSFPGKRIHEVCQEDKECGENMTCLKQQETTTESKQSKYKTKFQKESEESNYQGTSFQAGYCECIPKIFLQETESLENSLILLTDTLYNEQLCLPVRNFNQSCFYDQQCQINDISLECRFQENFENKDVIDQNLTQETMIMMKFCLCKSNQYWNENMCTEKTNFQQTKNKNEKIFNSGKKVWWIIGSYDDPNVIEHHVQLPYFSLVQFFTGLLFLIPLTVIIFTFYLICRTKCYRNKRSKWNSRNSAPYLRQVPDNIFHGSSSQLNESYYYDKVKNQNILPKISEMKIIKAHQSKKKEDKQDLIDADQLDYRNQV